MLYKILFYRKNTEDILKLAVVGLCLLCFKPKTCINYFQEENYAFNIKELQKCCACIIRINLMRPYKVVIFENSLPLRSAYFTESVWQGLEVS